MPQDPREPDAGVQIALAEFAALRTEIERRATIQWNVFALQITSAGAIASLAIASISRAALLLVVPLSSYMLGGRYILHDHHIKVIHGYIRNSLSTSLSGRLGWERWQEDATGGSSRSLFTATGWNWTHPTRLAFEGVGTLALLSTAFAAAYDWRTDAPPWFEVVGFAVLFALGAVATLLLHRSFTRAAPTGSVRQTV
jgi:hypothetical protein